MWAKIPTATASIACAACIAAASVAVPMMTSTTDYGLAKTIAAEVNLTAINFGDLAWLDALPPYQALLGGDLNALGELALTDAIPAYLNLLAGDSEAQLAALDKLELLNAVPAYLALAGGDLEAGFGGLALTDAIPSYLALADGDLNALGDLALTDAVPSYLALASGEGTVGDLRPLESVNGVYSFSQFPEQGFEAFVPVEADEDNGIEANPGYAALSGVSSWQNFFATGDISSETGLGRIDAFSALPAFNAPEEVPTSGARMATAAAPEETEAPAEESQTEATPLSQVKTAITSALPKQQAKVTTKAELPAAGAVEALTPQAPEAAPEPELKESKSTSSTKTAKPAKEAEEGTSAGGSYSGVFKPKKEEILFGSGNGNSADNGIRGWGEGLKKLGIGGGDAGSSEGGDAGSGDGGSE